MIKYLLIDLDDTILDFHKAEHIGLQNTLRHYGVEPTEETIALYLQINAAHWRALEKGEMTRKQVNEGRFTTLFHQLGREVDGEECAAYYLSQLALTHDYLPGAEAAVISLSKKYRLFVASNGNSSVQYPRLAASGLERYIEKAFISEALGQNKPSKAYFDLCFAQIPGFDPEKAMMVGDSLTSDIQGGINAGIPTCWVNTFGKKNTTDIRPDYEISSLTELETLLERL
jgi:2-haloacid dehalogenase